MHENRETSSLAARQRGSPAGEGQGRKSGVNGGEESDGVVVPVKSPNKAKERQAGAAEGVEAGRKKVAGGDVIVVRYADDLVVGFESRKEAERFLNEFQGRLANFGLKLHPEKARLIEFGRFARVDRRERGEGKPDRFTFLGFTHRCGTNSRGNFTIWRQTARQKLEAKLQQVKQALRERMHDPAPAVGEWLGRVLTGFYQYHAVPGNWASLYRFRERLGRY